MQLELFMKSNGQVETAAYAVVDDPNLGSLTDSKPLANKLVIRLSTLVEEYPAFFKLCLGFFPSGLLKLGLLAFVKRCKVLGVEGLAQLLKGFHRQRRPLRLGPENIGLGHVATQTKTSRNVADQLVIWIPQVCQHFAHQN